MEFPTNITEFAYFPRLAQNDRTVNSFNIAINDLENMVLYEKWSFSQSNIEYKNNENPILENYVKHTYKRLVSERKFADEENKNSIIYCNETKVCFNMGLFTKNACAFFRVAAKV